MTSWLRRWKLVLNSFELNGESSLLFETSESLILIFLTMSIAVSTFLEPTLSPTNTPLLFPSTLERNSTLVNLARPHSRSLQNSISHLKKGKENMTLSLIFSHSTKLPSTLSTAILTPITNDSVKNGSKRLEGTLRKEKRRTIYPSTNSR